MLVEIIHILVPYRCNTPLRIFGVGLVRDGLGHDDDLLIRPSLRNFQRESQARDTGAYHKKICLHKIKLKGGMNVES